MFKNLLIGFILTLFIVLCCFTYLGIKYIPKEIFPNLLKLRRENLFLALFSLFCYHTFDMLRVIIIARAVGVRYSLWYGYLVSLVNTFGATITPAHLGGELLPLYTLSRKGGHFYQILTIVTMKGLSGFFFYFLMLPFTLKALFNNPKQAKEFLAIISAILGISLLVYILYRFFKNRNQFGKGGIWFKLKRTFLKYLITCKIFFKTKKLIFFLAIFLSFGLYFSFLAIGLFLVKAFNEEIDLIDVFFIQLPLLYAIFISPTPGGSGVGELGALPIFSPFLPDESLGLFVILWRILSQYLSAILGGIIFGVFLFIDLRKRSCS